MPIIPTDMTRTGQIVTGTTPVTVLRNNPSRAYLLLSNLGSEAITVGLVDAPNAAAFLNLPADGDPVTLDVGKSGTLCTRGVVATSAKGASLIGFAETVIMDG